MKQNTDKLPRRVKTVNGKGILPVMPEEVFKFVSGFHKQIKEPEQINSFPRKKNKIDYLYGKSDFYTDKTFFIPAKHDLRFREALEKLLPLHSKTPNSIHSMDGDINFIFDILPDSLHVNCECFDPSSVNQFNRMCDWVAKWTETAQSVGAAKPETIIEDTTGWDTTLVEMWNKGYSRDEIANKVNVSKDRVTNRITELRNKFGEATVPYNKDRKKQLIKP